MVSGRDGAVDAQMRVLLAVVEIDGAGAERVLATAGHAVLVLAVLLGVALLHVLRRDPARPFLLVADGDRALVLQAVLADRDAVAARADGGFDQIEEMLRRYR